MQTVADGELGRFQLNANRFVVVTRFNGQLYVHIRQYKVDAKTIKSYPTKIGVSLNPSRYATLMMNANEISQALDNVRKPEPMCVEYKRHLGGGIYVTVTTGVECVDFRRYFVPEDTKEPIPTRNGIALKHGEWRKLIHFDKEIRNLSPMLINATPCSFDDSHNNQESAMLCLECNPFRENCDIASC